MQSLKDRLAVVTGASAGIGAATARALAGAGARLVLCARREDRLAGLANELARSGERPETLVLDVCDAGAVQEGLSRFSADILVNNAGLALGADTLWEGSPEDWSVVVDTNLKGYLNVLRAILPGMRERGRGDCVTLGSVAGRQVYPGGNVYCATKWAVRALYEAQRIELAGSGIRFTTVDPGMVRSEFSHVRFGGDLERVEKIYEGMTPLTPEDVADAVLYAVTRPPHMNVGEIVLWPTDQASTTLVHRR